MLAARADDGRYVPLALTPGTEPGQWRPRAYPVCQRPVRLDLRGRPVHADQRPSQFRTQGPLALTSRAYTKEYNEVKALGRDRQRAHP